MRPACPEVDVRRAVAASTRSVAQGTCLARETQCEDFPKEKVKLRL
jgi:hypothetical protein